MLRLILVSSLLVCAAIAVPRSPEEALDPVVQWSRLDALQGRVSQDEFVEAMDRVYAPKADWRAWMEVEAAGVWVAKGDGSRPPREGYFLKFGESDGGKPAAKRGGLSGLRIALDPGHIGGAWGPMEERSFAAHGGGLVQEGDLVLAAARRAAEKLRALGAEVFLTRDGSEPTTAFRPEDFREIAAQRLESMPGSSEERAEAVQKLAERLFYRTAEIRARADLISREGPFDFAVALHVNASGVEDPETNPLHEVNDLHVLVNGCYLAGELADESERVDMLWRLLKGYHLEERELAFAMKRSMREATELPPYRYRGDNAASLDVEHYIYARNLLANRIFDCPVVFLEPWQANSVAVYEWAAAGDYEGERVFGGESRRSLPVQYADMIVQGLLYRFGE